MPDLETPAEKAGRFVTTTRHENLEYLINTHGSQAALAAASPTSQLTQPILSTILRKKRPLWSHEARGIEVDLKIPTHWLDRYPLRSAWKQLRRFRELPPESVALFNEMLAFTEQQANSETTQR